MIVRTKRMVILVQVKTVNTYWYCSMFSYTNGIYRDRLSFGECDSSSLRDIPRVRPGIGLGWWLQILTIIVKDKVKLNVLYKSLSSTLLTRLCSLHSNLKISCKMFNKSNAGLFVILEGRRWYVDESLHLHLFFYWYD